MNDDKDECDVPTVIIPKKYALWQKLKARLFGPDADKHKTLHAKVSASLTVGNQSFWICSKCGYEGFDELEPNPPTEYEKIRLKFKKDKS